MADVEILHRGLTWQEFLDLPDDDRYRHAELINGEVVVTAASPLHQQIVNRRWAHIDAWTRAEPEGRILRPADDLPGVFVDAVTDIDRDGELSSPLLPGFAVRLGDLVER